MPNIDLPTCMSTWWMFFTPPKSTRHSTVVSSPPDSAHGAVYRPFTARSAV